MLYPLSYEGGLADPSRWRAHALPTIGRSGASRGP